MRKNRGLLRRLNDRAVGNPLLVLAFGVVALVVLGAVLVLLGAAFVLATIFVLGGIGVLAFVHQAYAWLVALVLIGLGFLLFVVSQNSSLLLNLGGFPVR